MTAAQDTAGDLEGDLDGVPAPDRSTALVVLIGGLLGAAAALALLLDKLELLRDPEFVPSCSIDAVLSCGTIMRSAQADVFGFPNPIIGVVAFPLLAALGALLLSGTVLPEWCWQALQVGVTAGVVFVGWLIVQSVAVLGALCPWCMLVWLATITVFVHVTAHNLAAGRLAGGAAGALIARRPALTSAVLLGVVLLVLVAAFPLWFASLLVA